MKFTPIALGTIALAASLSAGAQTTEPSNSSVTIYGVVDAYVQSAHGAVTENRVQSGGLNGSRIGFRGNEDLGGGLKALFVLESGINLDDGTNGQGSFWGRQAFVGLGSQYGSLTLGRQYGSIYTLSNDFSAFGNTNVGPSTAVIGGFGGYEPVRGGTTTSATGNGGPARINNSIKFESASYAGFRGGVTYGAGEVAGATNDNRIADVYGRYTQGPFDAMVSFVDDKGELNGLDVRTTSGAAAYTFGPARLTAGIISVDDRTADNADGRGYWVGGDYRFGQHLVRAQYLENKARNVDVGSTKAFGVGYQYDLSKRTAVYSSLTQFNNDGAGYANRWNGSAPAGLMTADDRDVTEFVAGIRHSF
jgi:predicted porin